MKRQDYYPARLADRPEWHLNLAAKIQLYGATLGLTTAQINQAVADNLMLAYALGVWILNVRDFGPAGTAALTLLTDGTGSDEFEFPAYTAPTPPTLPAGITGVLPGALNRTFLLIKEMKAKPAYTEPMGLDMRIIGAEESAPPPGTMSPRIKVTAIPGVTYEHAQIKFFKDGHQYVMFECRRGNGSWESIGMSNKSPFIDDRALLVAGQAEVREYRARFFDNGAPNGDWCDVAKLTVSP